DTLSATTPLIGIASLALIVIWARNPRLNRIPAYLIAVVAVTAVTWIGDIETPTVLSRYGAIPDTIPQPSFAFFDASMLIELLPAAFSVAVLSSVESLLSAMVADGMAPVRTKHDPGRELFGQGLANVVSPLM